MAKVDTVVPKERGQPQNHQPTATPNLRSNPPPQVTKKEAESKNHLKKGTPKSLGQPTQTKIPSSPPVSASDVATDKKEAPAVNVKNNLLIHLNEYSSPVARFFARIVWVFTWPFAKALDFNPAFDRFLDKQNLADKLTNELIRRNSSQEINTLLEELNKPTEDIPQQQGLDTKKEASSSAENVYSPIFDDSEKKLMTSGKFKALISNSIQSETDISADKHDPRI